MTPAAAVEDFAVLAQLGIDQAIVSLPDVYREDVFDILGSDVIPAVEKLAVAGR